MGLISKRQKLYLCPLIIFATMYLHKKLQTSLGVGQNNNCFFFPSLEKKRHSLIFFSVKSISEQFDIQIRKCFAFDETDTSLLLVDDRGCSIERLISDFTYDKSAGTAEATLYSMFRLPHSNRTYFQCEVTICKDRCPKVNCADVNEQLKLQAEGQLTTIEDEADPFEAAPDDSVTTSTSVFIAQPGSSASGK